VIIARLGRPAEQSAAKHTRCMVYGSGGRDAAADATIGVLQQ
jgi:hypothetical protein